MEQSSHRAGLHVAIIMDGNGRWATRRGLPRTAGHREGAAAVRRVVEAATRLPIGTLTLYAFSQDNWRRPPQEVHTLFRLFAAHFRSERRRCREAGVRMSVIGRRDRLPRRLRREVEAAEAATAGETTLHLRVALDYSARWAIADAVTRARAQGADETGGMVGLIARECPAVDLLIRTGGERRLSDFLLWECAYAELDFLELSWPDFTGEHLRTALERFTRRERRFGGLVPVTTAAMGVAS